MRARAVLVWIFLMTRGLRVMLMVCRTASNSEGREGSIPPERERHRFRRMDALAVSLSCHSKDFAGVRIKPFGHTQEAHA